MERYGKKLYPLCEILYKKYNSEGWYFGCMGREEEECKKKCEELKKEYGWYDYKCFVKSWWVVKPATKFQIYTPRANSMHETSNFIYSTQEQKYYYPEEIIPYPQKEIEIDDNFKITIKGEDDNVCEPEYEEDFNEKTEVLILFGSTEYENFVLADYMVEDIKTFIDRLKKENYSNLSVLEYTNTKLLAWKKDNTVRLIIQNYNDDDIIIEYDKLIPENIFYREFDKLYEKLVYYINRRAKMYEEFKEQENFLHSLKWIYDKQNINIPCEYISLSVVELIEKEFENSKYGVLLDIIVDKKYFIYSFYTELSFTELDKEDIKLKDVNFNIFDKYLGYIPSTEKEKKLKDCLYEDMPDLNKIEQLLKEGANPNALLDGYDIETLFESFLHDFNCYNDFDTSNLNLSNHKYTNLTNRNERIYCELRDKLYDIIKLFLKYGGKPRDIFCAIYSETRTLKKVRLLLDGHCKYSMNTLGFVSTDTWIGGDRWCERFYGALDKMFTKYHNFYSYECDENLKIVYRYSE